jgi:sterol desaturase/sphingolipid hydroxylase (fatty acid hydroxylase superfamily)
MPLTYAQAIGTAIPFFFVLIGIELGVAWKTGGTVYRFNDSISDLSCGVAQQAFGLLSKTALLGIYAWILTVTPAPRWSLESPWTWITAMLWVDFAYYWWHRVSHRVNAFWAVHVVHHQSQEYNLTVALRQSMVSDLSSIPFYAPLAIAGVPAEATLLSIALSTLYQFWIHTRLVGKLPRPVEWLFNTASHHRVHHAINPRYIDKNYAAILMVWDRWFGTFTPELTSPGQEPVYGTVKRLDSWNPLWANLDSWVFNWRAANGWKEKLLSPFMPPEWAGLGKPVHVVPEPDAAARALYNPAYAAWVKPYIVLAFIAVALLLRGLLMSGEDLPLSQKAAAVAWILAGVAAWGALLENRRWGVVLEAVRWSVALALLLIGTNSLP